MRHQKIKPFINQTLPHCVIWSAQTQQLFGKELCQSQTEPKMLVAQRKEFSPKQEGAQKEASNNSPR